MRTISVDDTPERELDPRARTNSIDPDEVFTASTGQSRDVTGTARGKCVR